MSGIAPNPLNAISKVYLDQVAEAKVEPPKEKLKTDRNMFNIPKDEQQAAKERLLAKSAAKRKAAMEALDPVGQEDADIDNDGDTDKSDKYLHKRRKAIGKAMKKRMKEEKELAEVTKMGVHAPHEVPDKNLKGLVKKAVKRIDADNDGDVDKDDPKETGMGEFVPSPDGKKKVRTKMAESLSNWRTDLAEIMDDDIDSKPIKEKKVNNKIKINPTLGEALEEIGATLIEMVEIDEFDFVVESVYDELLEEGYGEDDIEEAIEYALTEAKVTFGHDTPTKKDDVMKKAKGRLRYLRRKVGEKIGAAKKSAKYASAKAQVAAYNKGREVAQTAGYKTRKARQAVADAPGKAKKSVKGFIKKQAEKVAKRMSEENEIEEGIGMTMAKAVGNPPALSKRMKLKQALLNREIRKNAAENKKKSYSGKAANEEVEQIEEGLTDLQRRRYLGRNPGESKERLKRSNERKDKKAALAAMQKQYKGMKAGIYSSYEPEGEQLDEVINMKKADMGDVVKDFYKSDAPQFKGKSKEKRRQMAIAAKLTAERGGRKLGEGATEMPMSPQELSLLRKKTAIDMMIAKKRQQALQKAGNSMKESAEDRLRDRRMERGGVDGNTRYDLPPAKKLSNAELGIKPGKTQVQKDAEKKYGKGASAMDIVKAEIRAKYGKGTILGDK